MNIDEIINTLHNFPAVVRIVNPRASITVTTSVTAVNLQQARAILIRLYGEGNILRLTQTFNEDGSKIISPQEQQAKTMSDQAKRLQQQAKQLKARNKLAQAQQQLLKATSQRANH
jgi:hypothetical protein